MPEGVQFNDRPAGLAELARRMQRRALGLADLGKDFAIAIAPEDTGRYKESFSVRPITKRGMHGARLANNAKSNGDEGGYLYPLVIEFGYVDDDGTEVRTAQRVLGKAATVIRSNIR
jgi:hypothetical protein